MAISTAVDLNAVARVVGIKVDYRDLRGNDILFLPQRLAVVAQGSSEAVYSTDKRRVMSASEAADIYGHGSPIHLAVRQLLPVTGDGVGSIPVTVYPLTDADGATVATGGITITGTQTRAASYRVYLGGASAAQFSLGVGDTPTMSASKLAEAVNGVLGAPVVAMSEGGEVTFTAKWAGQTGNDIKISIEGPAAAGAVFVVSAMSEGSINPDVWPALGQVGNVWETMILNALNVEDTETLDKFQAFGEGRWGALTRKPCVVFTGNTTANVMEAAEVSIARATDRVNSQLVAPGSPELPFVVAARQLARIATVANSNPARDYGSQPVTGLNGGADGVQWDYVERDAAVKMGSSTTELKDGVIHLSDTVTFYHPQGEAIPAYRYVCDIVKLQNIIFNMDLLFATPEWDGAPLIPDDQPTVNRDAKKPKMAVATVCSMIDTLGLNAIISDPAEAKRNTVAEISSQNPKRLDVRTIVQLVGNANIVSVDLDFGFYFGTPQILMEDAPGKP